MIPRPSSRWHPLIRPASFLWLAISSLAAASPIGTADSPAAYELTKAANSATMSVTGTSLVEKADTISAGEDVVRLSLGEGDVVLVDRDSEAHVDAADRVSLSKGNMMAATSTDASRQFAYEGLVVESLPSDETATDIEASSQSILLMSQVEPATVNVAAKDGRFSVHDAASNQQIAFLGNGDAMQFRKVNEAWVLQSQPLASPFEPPASIAQGSLNYDIERAAYIWWAGGIGAGVGGGLLLLDFLDERGSDGNNDPDDEDRPFFSPIY